MWRVILSPFPLHFLILSPFSRSPAARLPQVVQPCSAHNKRTAVESGSVLRSAEFNWVPLFILASLSFHCTVPRTRGQRTVSYENIYETLPKAQRTRGLSSSYQSNLFRSYHKFLQKSCSNLFFKVSTKHQLPKLNQISASRLN